MVSKKCQKYMDRYKEKDYATKKRILKENDRIKYINRSPKRQASEASYRNRLLQSGEKQDEEEVKLIYKEPSDPPNHYRLNVDKVLNDAWVINLKGTSHGNDGTNRETRSDQDAGREQEIQSGISNGSFLAMQDVPEKQYGRKGKKRNSKKHNDGPQKQKGE